VERAIGIGGFFFRAKDPEALARWYAANLGIPVFPATDEWWMQQGYFGRADQQAMVNLRVRDLEAVRAQLRAAGATVSDDIRDAPYGRFCWATDPESNRFELWQPSPDLQAGS
jgi:glyoxylase I family protein